MDEIEIQLIANELKLKGYASEYEFKRIYSVNSFPKEREELIAKVKEYMPKDNILYGGSTCNGIAAYCLYNADRFSLNDIAHRLNEEIENKEIN